MGYIEFLGQPGAGKTTIINKLISHPEWYGGVLENASWRWLRQDNGMIYRFVIRILPSQVKTLFDKQFLKYRCRKFALKEFVREHPGILQTSATAVQSVKHEPGILQFYLIKSIENYALGIQTVRGHECLCLDEGYSQRAVSILLRQPSKKFSLDQYFETTPTPSAIVHLRADSEVCLDRQRDRGHIVSIVEKSDNKLKKQRQFGEICEKIADEQRSRTTVLSIDNSDDIDYAIDQIETSVNI